MTPNIWQKLFNAPWPDTDNVLPLPVQQQAERKIRGYWQKRGWQLLLGEGILYVAAIYQHIKPEWVYGLLALLITAAYALSFVRNRPVLWLAGGAVLFLAHGMLVSELGPVTALTFIMPYTFAGMMLSGRPRVIVQTWCTLAFWISLIYGVLPFLPQVKPPNYIVISYDILLAAFTFETMRFINHLTVEINSAHVATEIRGQSQQFLARVSHELRTPLNSVLGFAKLLRRTELADQQRHYLNEIIEEGEQLNRLVSDLLDSAHLSTGKLTLHCESCDVNALCAAIAEEQRPALPAEVTLRTDLAPGLPSISADPVRLRQAIGNLISNAVKYTSQGEISLTTVQHDDKLSIEIRDSGIGIPETQQGLVFLPFVQLDSRQLGVGLGLDIALQIIHLHGGEIHLASAPGQGSTFTVELPIA